MLQLFNPKTPGRIRVGRAKENDFPIDQKVQSFLMFFDDEFPEKN